MSKATTRALRVRLPLDLLRRAAVDAEACGLTLRRLVEEAAHGALAERLCRRHGIAAAPAEPDEDD